MITDEVIEAGKEAVRLPYSANYSSEFYEAIYTAMQQAQPLHAGLPDPNAEPGEIADGAWGDDPATRGRARDALHAVLVRDSFDPVNGDNDGGELMVLPEGHADEVERVAAAMAETEHFRFSCLGEAKQSRFRKYARAALSRSDDRLRSFAETVPDNTGGGCPWCLSAEHWAGRVELCPAPASRAIAAALEAPTDKGGVE